MLIYFTNLFFLILFLAEGQNRKYSFILLQHYYNYRKM